MVLFLPQLIDGYIVYTYTNSLTPQTFLFDDVAVNDGQWHDFEARWLDSGKLIMLLDFGQRQVSQHCSFQFHMITYLLSALLILRPHIPFSIEVNEGAFLVASD